MGNRGVRQLTTIWMLALFAALALAAPHRAVAQSCTFSIADVDFGDVDLATSATFTTTTTINVTCWGTANRWVIFCPNINAGSGGVAAGGDPRYMLNGPSKLGYNLYRSGTSAVWGSYVWPHTPKPPVYGVYLTGSWWFGVGSGTVTMDAKIHPGQTTLPAGLYTSNFSGSQTYFEYDYYNSGVWCNNMPSPSVAYPSFTVRANNVSTCSVSATDLDFGSTGVLSSNVDATSSIMVRCTSGVSYNIGLSGGSAGASNPALRQMSNGGNTITYGIYSDSARTLGWGDLVGVNTVASAGTGSTQTFTAYGRVPPQATPPAGTYTDTIVVTVTY